MFDKDLEERRRQGFDDNVEEPNWAFIIIGAAITCIGIYFFLNTK